MYFTIVSIYNNDKLKNKKWISNYEYFKKMHKEIVLYKIIL